MQPLACLALRLLTRRSLEGRTLAGDAVRDSEMAPIDVLLTGPDGIKTAPVISIYVDETAATVEGRDMASADTEVHLLIELAIAAPVPAAAIGATATDPAAPPSPPADPAAPPAPEVDFVLPATSPGLEASLELIAYQVRRALIDEGTPWGRLWTQLVSGVTRVHTYRGADFRKTGVRYAARQIEIVLSTLFDPVPGAALQGPWADIVAALEADATFAHYGASIRSLVSGQALPGWRRLMMSVGDTVADAEFLGYGPLGGGAGDDVVPMAEAAIDVSNPGAPAATITVVEGEPLSFEP